MKKYIYIMAMFVAVITMLVVAKTYALFETNAISSKDLSIGAWHIEVNGEDISLAETITLDDFTYTGSTHTESGYFAPGSTAVFDVEIDASDCDVSVGYDLTIDDSAIDDYPNIYFSIKNMDTNTELTSNTYSGISYLNDQDRVVNLRITLVWDDNALYNESDNTLIGEELEFVINANFEQYIGV